MSMKPTVKKKLLAYLVFVVVMCTVGFAVSLVFDPIPNHASPAADAEE